MIERETIQDSVLSLFSEKLNLDVASPETDLVDTGLLDSLKFVELLVELEHRFGVRIAPDDLEIDSFRSIERIADFVVHRNGPQRNV